MAIFYMKVNIIGRSSGRSAIGAAAYRRSAKMQSVAHAAYQRGEKIYEKGDKITHDYRAKGGVVHSEIILPEGAPPEFTDAQTLWNTVEKSEKRKDAQLAREIIVALPKEFNLEKSVEVLRAYLQENFVKIGMVADFSIHDKGDGNPHAHIMFTTRNVTPDGFGKKNTDWNKKELLLEWRKAWANIVNSTFERKGLDERIDHRSYKEQGLDRLPTIHMGHAATALERQGVRTEKGDYNREIQRRNAERGAQKTEHEPQITGIETDINNVRNAPKYNHGDAERNALMSAKRNIREIEEQIKAEKLQEQRAAREETENAAKPINELWENYIALDGELYAFQETLNEANYHLPSITFRAENLDEHIKNTETLQNRSSTLRQRRKKAKLWEIQLKRDLDKEIEMVKRELLMARAHFKVDYGIAPEQAPEEIKRVEEKINAFTYNRNRAEKMIPEISKKLKDIEKEYHQRKLLAQTRPDWEQIEKMLKKWRKPPESVCERLHYERINRRLNMVADESVEHIIREIDRRQAQEMREMLARSLTERVRIRERERERKQNRNRIIVRSR